jgi:hypothetical protein
MRKISAAALAASALAGCVAIPDLPPEPLLPVQEILKHTICELHYAFVEANAVAPEFDAKHWLIGVSLTPKVDTDVSVHAGLTGKNDISSAAKFVTSWFLGSSPGAQFNAKGHRDGSVTFNVDSKLLVVPRLPLDCNTQAPSYHVLATNLKIREWILRTALVDPAVGPLVKIDKPSYNSSFTIKFNGNGGFTYVFPHGSHFGSVSGTYTIDETLGISMVPNPEKKVVVVRTLPTHGVFAGKSSILTTRAPVDAQYRLDQLQLEQTLRNLRVQPQ